MDAAVDAAERGISLGVAQVACRLAVDGVSFARTCECLKEAAGLEMSDETLRQLVESEGRAVIAAQEAEQLELDWHAGDCLVLGEDDQITSRLYTGCDGVMVPVITLSEKQKRRAKAKQRRRQLQREQPQKKLKPLPALCRTANGERYREMKVVGVYDQDAEHRLVRATRRRRRRSASRSSTGRPGSPAR